MTIEQNLTDKTKRLLDVIKSKGINIELEVRPDLKEQLDGVWGVIPTYKIVTEIDKVNKASFTHELLHVYLYTIGFVDSDIIFNQLNNPNYIFSRDFIIATNNNLAHFKMVKKFEELGFNRSDFFGTTVKDQLELTSKHIKEINSADRHNMMQEFVNAYSSLRFLNEYFFMDTATIENRLLELDSDLYEICKEEFTKWINSSDADNLKFFKSLKERLV